MAKDNFKKVDADNVKKNIDKQKEKLVVNGLYLPEKNQKENLIQRSLYLKPSLYESLYKISKVIDCSINEIHVRLAEQFVEQNKHLLKTKKEN